MEFSMIIRVLLALFIFAAYGFNTMCAPTKLVNSSSMTVKMVVRQEFEIDLNEGSLSMPFVLEGSIVKFIVNGKQYEHRCEKHPNHILAIKESQDIVIKIDDEEVLRIPDNSKSLDIVPDGLLND